MGPDNVINVGVHHCKEVPVSLKDLVGGGAGSKQGVEPARWWDKVGKGRVSDALGLSGCSRVETYFGLDMRASK